MGQQQLLSLADIAKERIGYWVRYQLFCIQSDVNVHEGIRMCLHKTDGLLEDLRDLMMCPEGMHTQRDKLSSGCSICWCKLRLGAT